MTKLIIKNKLTNQELIFLTVVLIPGFLFSWSVEWSFVVLTTVGGVYHYSKFNKKYPNVSICWLLIICCIIIISTYSYIITTIQGTFETGGRDFVEIVKILMIFFSCSFAHSFNIMTTPQLRRVCRIVMIYSLICGLIYLFKFPVLTNLLKLIYDSSKTNITEWTLRLSIPFENPNFLGLFCVLSLCSALFLDNKIDYFLGIISLTVTFLTGSRTALVSAFISILCFIIVHTYKTLFKTKRINLKLFIAGTSILLFLIMFLPDMLSNNTRLVNSFNIFMSLDISADHSYAAHIELRNQAILAVMQRPFLGWGATKYSDMSVVDNEFFYLLLRFGGIGVFLTCCGWIYLLKLKFYQLNKVHNPKFYQFYIFILVIMIFMWTGSFIENIRITMLIFMFLSSIGVPDEKF